MICKESSKQRFRSGGIRGTRTGAGLRGSLCFPPCLYFVLCFWMETKCSERWQRTEYPEQAEPGLGPNALARIRGSRHRPSQERVSIASVVTAEEGRFGADGAASVAVSRYLPSLGVANVPSAAGPEGYSAIGDGGSTQSRLDTQEEDQGRRNFQGGRWKHQCREQLPVRTSMAACCSGVGAESCSPHATCTALICRTGTVPQAAGAPAGPADSGQCRL